MVKLSNHIGKAQLGKRPILSIGKEILAASKVVQPAKSLAVLPNQSLPADPSTLPSITDVIDGIAQDGGMLRNAHNTLNPAKEQRDFAENRSTS